MFEAVFREAGLPEGLLHVVLGGADVGEAIVTDPNVTRVSFTGSTAAGRRVGALAGDLLKRVSLELGGNNAFVVLDDADLEAAASAGAFASFQFQGQVCFATGRHIVHRSVAAAYIDLLAEKAARLRLGDPYREEVDLGPIVNQKQLERVDGIVRRSVEGGAHVVVGGTHEGLFYRPTVLTDVTTDQAAWREEIFGPVAPVVVFDTDEEALALANDSEYGLTGAVYSSSISRGLALAQRFRSGMVHVNDQTVNDEATIPFGGMGASGTGPLRRPGQLGRVHRVAVGDRARRAQVLPVPVLSATTVASITEVARLAGVSAATASRVVSASDYPVSAATRERVLEAARTLDYVPNALARGLLKSRVPVVAVIVHDITDPYFSEVVRGVEDAASAAGYLVITCSSERDADREAKVVRLLRSIRAAAVVFAGSGLDDPMRNDEMDRHLAAMRADGAAIVHLSPHAHGEPEVGVDNAAGIAAMVGALVGLGHRRIAFLAGPSSLFVARERLAGYRQGLEAAGLPYDERLVVRSGFDAGGGALGVDVLLDAGIAFTAIACANDLLALGALQRLAALGIAVPGAVSVAGFDDISTAALTAPSLSTVRLPLRELGRRGFAHADAVLRGADAVPVRLPTTVILRDSTAAPASTVAAPATAVPAGSAVSRPAAPASAPGA